MNNHAWKKNAKKNDGEGLNHRESWSAHALDAGKRSPGNQKTNHMTGGGDQHLVNGTPGEGAKEKKYG